MLSFDLSAIDLVLLVAVFILFSLYLSKKPGTQKAETKKPQYDWQTERNQEPPPISKKQLKASKTKHSTAEQPNAGFRDCTHEFGYLKDLPRNTPIPEECFGCTKVMQCLFPNE